MADMNAHVYLGNPDVVIRPDSLQTARVGLTELDIEAQLNAALYGQVASTVPEQDRMTKIRVRYPDRVRFDRDSLGLLPISLATATPAGRVEPPAGDRPGWASSRSASSRRSARSAAPTSCGGKISSPSSRSPPSWKNATWARSTASCETKLSELKFPPGLPLGAGGQLPGAAGVVREPDDGPDRIGGARLPAAGLPVP